MRQLLSIPVPWRGLPPEAPTPANFSTDLQSSGATNSELNDDIMNHFTQGRDKLTAGLCIDVIPIKRRIVQLMSVPMVQGSLRYAYKVSVLETPPTEKSKAEGWIFTAGILPLAKVCNADVGTLLSQQMKWTSTSTVFTEVKAAYESIYACLGMTCDQVGELLGVDNT